MCDTSCAAHVQKIHQCGQEIRGGKKVIENHYGRKYKDSNDLLQGSSDCFVVTGFIREWNLHSKQSP